MTLKEKVLEVLEDKRVSYRNLSQFCALAAKRLDVEKERIKEELDRLIKAGDVIEGKDGRVFSIKSLKIKKGTVAKKSKEYLFVTVPGVSKDYYIPSDKTKGALSGDIVLVRPTGGNFEAEVVKIVEKVNKNVVGILKKDELGFFVETGKFNKPIYIQEQDLSGAEVNDLVVTKILYQPSSREGLQGEVSEVLGKSDDKAILEKALIKDYNIPTEYTPEAIKEAENMPSEISSKDKVGRLDLTGETIFTIDGPDARDLDDAVSIKKRADGTYRLGVHIADVGNYVKVGSALDENAFTRGTSVYFPDNVIPMLPKRLSNGICSLNPNVERLALSVFMDIDKFGNVTNHEIHESVIKSVQRFTYDEVYGVMMGDEELSKKFAHLGSDILAMKELSDILTAKRKRLGGLDFEIPEAEFEMNDRGEVTDVVCREHNEAHKLIENFMVACNETVAKHFADIKYPFVYRVHEAPAPESVQNVLMFIEGLGLKAIVPPKHVDPLFYQKLIKLVEDKPQASVLNKVFLISMKKARYDAQNLGHFGLASTDYCHFTSPIRRYPDLTIHRIIKDSLHRELSEEELYDLEDFVAEASEQSSRTERRADDAERAVDDLKKAEYISRHIGEEFEGVISGVTSFGIFVQLPNTVEGLIKTENLPADDYVFIEKQLKLAGKKKIYALGDPIKVRVEASNMFTRKVDFSEVQEKTQAFYQGKRNKAGVKKSDDLIR